MYTTNKCHVYIEDNQSSQTTFTFGLTSKLSELKHVTVVDVFHKLIYITLVFFLKNFFFSLSSLRKWQNQTGQSTMEGVVHSGHMDSKTIHSTIDAPPGVSGVSKDAPGSTKYAI